MRLGLDLTLGGLALRQAGGAAPVPPPLNITFAPVIDARGADVGVESRIAAALAAAKPIFVQEAVLKVREINVAVPGYLR